MPQHRLIHLALAASLALAAGAQAADTSSGDASADADEQQQASDVDEGRMRALARAYMAVSSLKSEKAEEAETVVDPDQLKQLNTRYRERKHELVRDHGFEDFEAYESLLKRVESDPAARKRLARTIVQLR